MSKYRLLILGPSFKRRAGVSDFCRMFLANLTADFCADYLVVGNRPANRSFLKRFLYLTDSAIRLVRSLKKNHYDIIHINPSFGIYCLFRESLYLLIINGLGYGSRTILFFHGWDVDLAEKVINNSLLSSVLARIYNRVGVIFVLHKQCRHHLINMGINPRKIRVTKTMYERISGGEYPGKEPHEKVIILFMSRIVKEKGAAIAVEAARLLVENGYVHFHLMFAGDGPFLPELTKLVAETGLHGYIDILGYASGAAKEEVLRKSDIFILPTCLPEGCPVVIMEAMGAGHAIVSTNRGAIPEVIEDGKNGFICDSKKPYLFYEALKALLDDRELLERIQKANKEKAEQNYEVSVYMRKMEKIYSSIINGI